MLSLEAKNDYSSMSVPKQLVTDWAEKAGVLNGDKTAYDF